MSTQALRPRERLQTDCRPSPPCLGAAMMVRWRVRRPDCQTGSVLCRTMCWCPGPRTVVWRQVRPMSAHRQRQAGLQDSRRATWWWLECGCAVLIVLKTNDRVHDSMELGARTTAHPCLSGTARVTTTGNDMVYFYKCSFVPNYSSHNCGTRLSLGIKRSCACAKFIQPWLFAICLLPTTNRRPDDCSLLLSSVGRVRSKQGCQTPSCISPRRNVFGLTLTTFHLIIHLVNHQPWQIIPTLQLISIKPAALIVTVPLNGVPSDASGSKTAEYSGT
jgi:hypothetical protein